MLHGPLLDFGRLSRFFAIVVLLASGVVAAPVRADESDSYLPNEVVVKLDVSADVAAVARAYGLDPSPIDRFGTRPIYRLRILDGDDPVRRAAELLNDPKERVIYAEPNYVGQTPEGRQRVSWFSGGSSDEYASQWAPDTIQLREAHRIARGSGVTVAVLDTGVDATHPALSGRVLSGYDFVDMDAQPNEVGVRGENLAFGHGTHVAGLVALAAPDAKIMPVRVLDPDGTGNIWVLAEALDYAADQGADVINMSLSTTRQTNLLREVVADVTCRLEEDGFADGEEGEGEEGDSEEGGEGEEDGEGCTTSGQRGVVVVAAAGNSGSTTPEYPAAEGVTGLLSVAATTSTDNLASFSNRGSWVNVAAPGEKILSAVPGGGYATWSGTSMAAPLTAGEAALVRSAYPTANSAQVVYRILSTATTISGPVSPRINAAAAVGALNSTSD